MKFLIYGKGWIGNQVKDYLDNNFDFDQNFKNLDFYVSKSNSNVFNLIKNWSKEPQKFLNIVGDKFSGKSHLINIFLEENKGFLYLKKLIFYSN